MKKNVWLRIMLMLVVAFAVGCSGDNQAGSTESEEKKLSAEEVYSKSLNASEGLNSFKLDMEIQQTIATPESEGQTQTISTKGDFVVDPLSYHMTTTAMDQIIEMYYTQDGMFVKDPNSGNWMKGPKELVDQLNQASSMQQNPTKQLEALEEYSDRLSVEETDQGYVIHLEADEEGMKQFIQKTLSQGGAVSQDMVDQMNINNLTYDLTIGKDQYYPKSLHLMMDVSMNQQGTEVNLNQDLSATYSGYNEVDEISVPEDIKQNAVDMGDMQQGTTP